MTEREHCEAVARRWLEDGGYSAALSVAEEIAPVADLIQRERDTARKQERDEALDTAAQRAVFVLGCGPQAEYVADAIRALKAKP